MKLINATPHAINLLSREGVEQDSKKQYLASEASGCLPRVSMTNSPNGEIDGFPVESVTYGEIENLPPQEEGIYYIVSGMVAAAATKIGRSDCLAPGALVRDRANGVVLGCLFLQQQ